MNSTKRHEIFRRFQAANPKPTTELNYRNEFELLIAVILSAQATDISVNKASAALFQAAPNAEAMFALGEDRLAEYIKTIGLYRSKARHIIACCQSLLHEHAGQVPRTREALEKLAGVGRKTANVVLNTAFGEPTLAVDTHIFRVANRTRLALGKNVRIVEDKLLASVPKIYLNDAHHWLILHGRYVCKARKPECYQCIIVDLCEYDDKVLSPTNRRAVSSISSK